MGQERTTLVLDMSADTYAKLFESLGPTDGPITITLMPGGYRAGAPLFEVPVIEMTHVAVKYNGERPL